MADFFGSRLLRWLTVPYRSRLFTVGVEAVLPSGRPDARLAVPAGHRRVLHPLPDDGAGLRRQRAGEVERLLADPRTAFVVVSTLEAAPAPRGRVPRRRAGGAADVRSARSCSTGRCRRGTRSSPARRPRARSALERGGARATRLARWRRRCPAVSRRIRVHACSREVGDQFHDIAIVASRESERRASARRWPPCCSTCHLARRHHDLAGLATPRSTAARRVHVGGYFPRRAADGRARRRAIGQNSTTMTTLAELSHEHAQRSH